ncbi:unnamed protein product [Phytomonas sp. Hart1]|nr:unnamed protein product [Phytomonas sp. Hart1]|eukprot:CCW72183.1 unnamed protein product [Phytomonas sp. isolate Hart1]
MRGVKFSKTRCLLFIYCNNPCIVIGRNQNIYRELSVQRAHKEGITVARRSSGGGAVYHDCGNLCFSFLTSRGEYAPEKTIQILRLALCHKFGIDAARLTTTKRHDLFLDGLKITGSAMRVQQSTALHHCTLLVNSNLGKVGSYLRPEGKYLSFATTSMTSVRSPVTTLSARGVGDGMLDTSDGLRVVEETVSDFFLSCSDEIIGHKAPWELQPQDFKLKLPTAKEDRHVVIDTSGAVIRDEPLLNANGYRPIRGECGTFRFELDRLLNADWLFSMPSFTTEVAITMEMYHQALKVDPLWSTLISPKLRLFSLTESDLLEELSAILFKETTAELGSSRTYEMCSLVIQTVLSQRLIKGVHVRRVCSSVLLGDAHNVPSTKTVFFNDIATKGSNEQGKEDPSESFVTSIPWLERFLQTVLTGTCCDSALAGFDDSVTKDSGVEMLLQGLRLEMALIPDRGQLADLPGDLVDDGLLLMARGIVKCWRDQNVFGISLT